MGMDSKKTPKTFALRLVVFSLLGATATIQAQTDTINFEDGVAAHPGLGFNVGEVGGAVDSLSVIDGLSEGDPGGWQIEGSNGPKMMGFWGSWGPGTGGYTGAGDTIYSHIYFTEPNSSTPLGVNVSFDVLLSTGNYSGNSLTFYGFQNGSQVASSPLAFAPVTINGYAEYLATVNFTNVDEIRYNNNRPGGLDNFIYSPVGVPEPSVAALAGLGGMALFWLRRKI